MKLKTLKVIEGEGKEFLKLNVISDEEIKAATQREFIPDIDGCDGIFSLDNPNEFARGGLFDPTIFGKTELKKVSEHPRFGTYGAYYTLSSTMYDPMAAYEILRLAGFSENDAYRVATYEAGITEAFDEHENYVGSHVVSLTDKACAYAGLDAVAYMAKDCCYPIDVNDLMMNVIYIIPPRLRPVFKDNDNDKTIGVSSINFLYNSLIGRDIRCKKLRDLKAPEIILINERRMLYVTLLQLMMNENLPNSAADDHDRPFSSLVSLLRNKNEKDRELINLALCIAPNGESTVRQVRIDKNLLTKADDILKERGTNFSEVIRMLIQEIVDSNDVPSIVMANSVETLSPEMRLYTAIFGADSSKQMSNEELQKWGKAVGLPQLKTSTLADLFDSKFFPKDITEGDMMNTGHTNDKDDESNIMDKNIAFHIRSVEQIKANIDAVAHKMKTNAINNWLDN